MSTLLEVKGIDVFYGDIQTLWGVSLEVHEGEIVSLVGPNGSGKTTLFKTIQGLLHPVSGEIRFLGQRIDRLPPYQLVELGLAYIPEGRRLFTEMSVRENLEVGAYIPQARGRAREALDLAYELFPTLKEKERELAGNLSGGEQQMLAVARGLMSQPKLLLLDDPFLGLARGVAARFCQALRRLNHGGITILVTGQHVQRLLRLAHRAYMLEAGRIVLEGEGEELLHNEHLRGVLL